MPSNNTKDKPPTRKKKPLVNPAQNKKLQFSIWYLLLAFIALYMFESYLTRQQIEKIPYSEFKKDLRVGKVVVCDVGDQKIQGFLGAVDSTAAGSRKIVMPDTTFWGIGFETIRVDDKDLVSDLEAAGVKFAGKIQSNWLRDLLLIWILPIAVLFVIWGFIMRRMGPQGGLMSIGKSKAKIYVEDKTKTTFSDVAGIDEAVEELSEVVEFLKHPDRFRSLGGNIPKGVLLLGAPGTGKTLLARAVAGEAKVPFFSLSGSDFVEMFVGVGAARVRDLFQQANSHAPCIVFIDELDALGKARGINPWGAHDEREQTLNQLLVEMDGFDANKGVIIMGATNRPEILDLALLRPGRFDRQIVVDRPDIKGREAILQVHARGKKMADGVDLKVVAGRTPGFVGADLANIINEAALLAARRGKKAVEMNDLEEAIDRVVAGLERKSRVLNPREKEIVAYHESGHAIVAESVPGVDPVHRVSIIPRGVAALGYTLQLPTEDRYLMSRKELISRMKVLLGGRVAEKTVFDEISTGAQNDLEKVTDIARSMVTEYGMSEKLGPISLKRRGQTFLGQDMSSGYEASEETQREIDCEIRKLIREAEEAVQSILTKKRGVLDCLAKQLLEKEVIEGDELREILKSGSNENAGKV